MIYGNEVRNETTLRRQSAMAACDRLSRLSEIKKKQRGKRQRLGARPRQILRMNSLTLSPTSSIKSKHPESETE